MSIHFSPFRAAKSAGIGADFSVQSVDLGQLGERATPSLPCTISGGVAGLFRHTSHQPPVTAHPASTPYPAPRVEIRPCAPGGAARSASRRILSGNP